MKRVVTGSILFTVVLAVGLAVYYFFPGIRTLTGTNPLQAVPADASLLFEVDYSQASPSPFSSLPGWNETGGIPSVNRLKKLAAAMDTLLSRQGPLSELKRNMPVYFSLHVSGAGSFDFLSLFSMPLKNSFPKIESLLEQAYGPVTSRTQRTYEGAAIKELTFKDQSTFAYTLHNNVFAGSFSAFLVEDAIRQQKIMRLPFTSHGSFAAHNSKNHSALQVHVRHAGLSEFLSVFSGNQPKAPFILADELAGMSDLSVRSDASLLSLNGPLYPLDSTSLVAWMRNQQPVSLHLPEFFPANTACAAGFACSDPAAFLSIMRNQPYNRTQLEKLNAAAGISITSFFSGWTGNEWAVVLPEPADTILENSACAVLSVANAPEAKKKLGSLCAWMDKQTRLPASKENYKGHEIRFLRLAGFLPALFGNYFQMLHSGYFTVLDRHVVFANRPATLRTWIDHYEAKKFASGIPAFKSAMLRGPSRCNFYFLMNRNRSRNIIQVLTAGYWRKSAAGPEGAGRWQTAAAFITAGKESSALQLDLQYELENDQQAVSLLWSEKLEAPCSRNPWIISNKGKNKNYILVQDDANTLHFFNLSGDRLWKRPLDEPVMSEVSAMDLYNTGSLQMVFNTQRYIYVLDDEGNIVQNFPIRLPVSASAGMVSVYRPSFRRFEFFIPCMNRLIYAYEGNGKPILRWNSQGALVNPAVLFAYFNPAGEDYFIAADSSGRTVILNGAGLPVSTASTLIHTRNSIPYYIDGGEKSSLAFISLDASGNLVKLHPNGEVLTMPLDTLDQSERFAVSASQSDSGAVYFFSSPGYLIATNRSLELAFASTLNSFHSDDLKIVRTGGRENYCLLASVEKDATLLFSLNGKLLSGFPVSGGRAGWVDDSVTSKNLLVTVAADGTLYVYSID